MNNLRKLRKEVGLSMRELGEKFGLAESTISLYENGKHQPSHETLLKFAEYFNVSVDYLLGREGAEEKELNKELANEYFALYGEIHDFTDEEKQDLMDFIQFIKMKKQK